MPGGSGCLALASRFRLPALRRPAMLRDQGAQALPVRLLPPSGFLTAGTIFHSTKLDLIVWFQAIYLVTQTKKGISSLELSRNPDHRLESPGHAGPRGRETRGGPDKRVEMDDAYLGGARRGGKRGRGAAAFVVTTIEGHPLRLTNAVKGFRKAQKAGAPWSPAPP